VPDVVRTWRTGGYGTTVWFHELACGHVVPARRRSPKPALPCAVCDQLAALPAGDDTPVVERDDPAPRAEVHLDPWAGDLEAEARCRAAIAARFGVTPDAVVVAVVDGRPVGATVSLTADQIRTPTG
jgi:hypothetical protein